MEGMGKELLRDEGQILHVIDVGSECIVNSYQALCMRKRNPPSPSVPMVIKDSGSVR